MATFSVNDTLRRAILTGNGSTTSFAFSFQINAITDIKVYVDGVLKTQGTGSANYAVQDGSGNAGLSNTGTGAVVFVTAPANATTITILSDIPLARTSLYTSGGNVTASSLENDFDTITMALGDREERDARSLQAPVQDPTSIDMTLPAKASRLGKLLGFNSSTGNPEATFTTVDGQTLSNIASDIATLADLQDGTTVSNGLSGLAGITGNITTVAGIGASTLTAIAGISSEIQTVAGDSTAISGASANATKAQNYATKVDGVVPNTSDFSAKAQAVGGTGVTDVTGSAREWAIGGGSSPNATTHVDSGDEYSAKGYAVGALDRGQNTGKHSAKDWASYTAGTVNGSEYSAKYWATQASATKASFDSVYQGAGSSDPTGGTVSAGDLFFNTTSSTLKFYNGSAWVAIEATDTSSFATKGFATALAVAL